MKDLSSGYLHYSRVLCIKQQRVMARNYASLAFSDASKALQEKHGSRRNYGRMEKQSIYEGVPPRSAGSAFRYSSRQATCRDSDMPLNA